MRIQQLSRAILITLAISTAMPALSEAPAIYKWQDDRGRTHYSDTPPANQDLAPLALPELNLQPTQVNAQENSQASTQTKTASPQPTAQTSPRKGVVGSLERNEETAQEGKDAYQEHDYYHPPYYPPYNKPWHQNRQAKRKHGYSKPCQYGRNCHKADKRQYLYNDQDREKEDKKRKQRQRKQYNSEQGYRRRATASYPDFKRPNIYWDPYSYNAKRYSKRSR
jgi:hypothetical protein